MGPNERCKHVTDMRMYERTSRRLKVEGYRKKKEMKLSVHTASCTKGWPLKFHSGRPSYLWLMKCTRANVARGRLIAAKMTLKALAPMSSSPAHQITQSKIGQFSII